MKDAIDPDANNARLIVKKLHVIWRHASAAQIRRIPTDAGAVVADVLQVVEAAARVCEVCMAFEEAPCIPVAGASSVSASKRKVYVDFLFLRNSITSHAMGRFSRYPMLVMVSPGDPLAWLCEPPRFKRLQSGTL